MIMKNGEKVKMTDSEILKNYAFMPMYVIAVTNYQGSRKERYLFVTKFNSDDGKIGYLECLDEGELLFGLKFRNEYWFDVKKTIKGLCKTLTKQSNILGSPLVKYRFVTDEAFYIVTSPKFKHRDFMYKWVKSADCKEMNLIEIVNGEPVPLKEKMIYGDPEIDGDYEYALLCLEANGFSAAKIKNPK